MREFDLLRHVYASNAALAKNVIIPPGDDLGMVRVGECEVLLGVDQLVDGRHVELTRTPLHLAGRKAITRCLSDVAAMAARPVAMLAAVTLPPGFGENRANELFDAMRAAAEQYGAPLVGGDIAFHQSDHHPLTCSITVIATPAHHPSVRRSGAKVDDGVYVTGQLGGAVEPDGGGRHLTFVPRIAEALDLLDMLGGGLHAMIDLSDGLGRDASHIADASGVALEIDASAIPCSNGVDWKRASSDGEDYELLFTTNRQPPASLRGTPVTRIGTVAARTPAEVGVVFRDGHERIPGDRFGWEHSSATAG